MADQKFVSERNLFTSGIRQSEITISHTATAALRLSFLACQENRQKARSSAPSDKIVIGDW